MKQAALGFRVHSGWTALVAVSLREKFMTPLLRTRPYLVKTFTFEYRQPYHTAEKLPAQEAEVFLSRLSSEARDLATQAVRGAQAELRKHNVEIKRCAILQSSGRALPSLPQILKSHALIHAADGEFFRDALLEACESCGISVFLVKECDLLQSAAEILPLGPKEILSRLQEAGRSLGPPWAQDEKLATLVAGLALLPPRG
jgi:hypothetical protein